MSTFTAATIIDFTTTIAIITTDAVTTITTTITIAITFIFITITITTVVWNLDLYIYLFALNYCYDNGFEHSKHKYKRL